MAKAISDINKLVNAESFLQINFVKGYKYVDRAGEIVNYFHKENKAPAFTMGLNGLDIFNPDEKIDSIKLSSRSFWAHFVAPDSLDQMDDFFGKKAQDIIKILEVDEISRIGWRSFFVHEFNTEQKRELVLRKYIPLDSLNFEEVIFTSVCESVNLVIRMRKVTKSDNTELPGLLLDIDFYQDYKDNFLASEEIVSKLTEFKKVMRSESLLKLINDILEENGK